MVVVECWWWRWWSWLEVVEVVELEVVNYATRRRRWRRWLWWLTLMGVELEVKVWKWKWSGRGKVSPTSSRVMEAERWMDGRMDRWILHRNRTRVEAKMDGWECRLVLEKV